MSPREGRGQGSKPAKLPPLVIVTVSGGGIRASVWTTTVLKALEDKRWLGPKFPYYVRLITGASGGMVGAAYFSASLSEPDQWGEPPESGKAAREVASRLAEDQLSAVAGCLAFNDIPGLLNPLQRHVNRGRKMEETWDRLTSVQRP